MYFFLAVLVVSIGGFNKYCRRVKSIGIDFYMNNELSCENPRVL